MVDHSYRKAYQELFREIQASSSRDFYFESAIPSYVHDNRLMSWLFWKRVEAAFSVAGDLMNKTVLDFGCGAGVTFCYLHACNCRIVACDNQFSHLAEESCRRFGIEAEIHQDLSAIKDRRFDVIFALDVLEHVEDPASIIDTLLKVSDPSTIFVISGPTENIFYRLGRALAGFSGHYHKRNIYDVEEILGKKNLKKRISKTLYYPIPLFRVSSWSM